MKNADSKQQEVLYLEICSHEKEGTLPLHTSIALFLLSYCECKSFKLFLVTSTPITSQSWKTQVPSFLGASEVGVEDLPWLVGGCRLPAVLDVTGMYCRAGLAVVLRHIINRTVDAEPSRKDVLALLGFKKTCLKACAEVSQWTRLCELGIPSAVEEHLQKSTDHSLQLPSAIVNLEKRLGEPVKVHNDDKIRRQKLKQQQRQQQMKRKEGETSDVPEDVNDKNQLDQLTPSDDLEFKAALAILSLDAVTPTATRECSEIRKVKTTELPPLEHVFAEGLYFTLTDVVLLPCIHRYLAETNIKPLCQSWHMFPLSKVVLGHLVKGDYTAKAFENKETSSLQAHCPGALSQLPLLLRWYGRVQEVPGVLRAAHACGMPFSTLRPAPPAPAEAPLTDRAERESPGKPTEVPFIGGPRPTMTKLKESGIEAVFSPHPCPAWSLPWDSLPAAVNPTEGKMSDGRAVRKRQQLNNLVTMVTELAKPGDTVVDFCSGGGHVGIVIAHTLPNSKVILIENKEESLVRAKERCTELGLANIGFIQANLDYFTGPFHIGVALHACGVATDMVVEHCVEAGAAFVVSPCCYGFIQNTVKFTFPRSKRFQETLNFKEHMVLCRFADQTAGQLPPERRLVGKQCMGLVDLDRSWAAEPHGYSVRVMTMEPESCSPKNNMLVGVFRGHTNAMPIRSIGPDPLAADSNIG